MQALVQGFGLKGGVFSAIAGFDLIGRAGYVIVAAFVLAWVAALLIYKARRIDERWSERVRRVA
jgi:nickel/cobalt transporter (NiCoT) family protein